MGQRHQVYIVLPAVGYPDCNGRRNPNNRGPKVVGFHHQWLYGWTAVRFLSRALRYVKTCSQQASGPFSNTAHDALSALAALYSFEESTGYYHRVHLFEDEAVECNNPHLGDNNDGITVLDLSGDKPAYCFYSLGSTESAKSLAEGCYSAAQYLKSYYSTSKPEFKPVSDYLAGFSVLTAPDMRRIFPNMVKVAA